MGTSPHTTFTARPPGRRARLRQAATWVVAACALGVLSGGIAVADELGDVRRAYDGRALPGTVVHGVDISGLDHATAVAEVAEALAPTLDREVHLTFDDRRWTYSLRQLGARLDLDEVVDGAISGGRGVSWQTLAMIRWRDGLVPSDHQVSVDLPATAARRAVERLAEELRVEPTDAHLTWTRDRLRIEDARDGLAVVTDATLEGLLAALSGEADTAPVVTRSLQPGVTRDHYAQVLFLRQQDHRLDLYLNGVPSRTYVVATGTNNYPTPTGVYEVSLKRRNPTWVNPDPTGWGRGMPARIGPGPNNPLGLRALNWSAPGAIRFHGTAAVDSLGRDASHGCVRLSNGDIVELFELVDEGATIVSIR